jgi:hypothetical protein
MRFMADQVFEEGHQVGRTLLLVGAQLGQAPGEEGVLQRADALEGAPAIGGDAHPGAAPIGVIGDPGHHAGLRQGGDNPRHGRRLHLLDRGQLAEGGAAQPLHRSERRRLRG